MLGKIKELDRERAADLIVVDAPPAGHAAPFLRSATALQQAVASGPVREQADEVSTLLADHDRCQCVLVTLPEETPVNEAIELAFDLEDDLGLALAPLVVNACWPERPGLALTAVGRGQAAGGHAAGGDEARARRRHPVRTGTARRSARAVRPPRRGSAAPARAPPAAAGGPPAAAPPRPARGGARHRPDRPEHPRLATGGGAMTGLAGVLHDASLVVTCGPGGVGKTTTAAALALGSGRRRSAGHRGHRRPRQAARRHPRHRRHRIARAVRGGRGDDRRRFTLGADARRTGHVRPDDRRSGRRRAAGAGDPRQPDLPQHRRFAVGRAGVHGDRAPAPALVER